MFGEFLAVLPGPNTIRNSFEAYILISKNRYKVDAWGIPNPKGRCRNGANPREKQRADKILCRTV